MYLSDKESFFSLLNETGKDALFNPVPVAFQVLIAAIANKNLYTGRPIVPTHLREGHQAIDPALQTKKNTPALARAVAGAINAPDFLPNVSPAMTDYVLNSLLSDLYKSVAAAWEPWAGDGSVFSKARKSASGVLGAATARAVRRDTLYTDAVVRLEEMHNMYRRRTVSVRSLLGEKGDTTTSTGRPKKISAWQLFEDPQFDTTTLPDNIKNRFVDAMGKAGFKTRGKSFVQLTEDYTAWSNKYKVLNQVDKEMKNIKTAYYKSGQDDKVREATDSLAKLTLKFLGEPTGPMNPKGTKVGGEGKLTPDQISEKFNEILGNMSEYMAKQ